MNLTLTDILFFFFAFALIVLLIWELIPDCAKKYWGYLRQIRKDYKQNGRSGKYIFSFRIGPKSGGQND